MLREFLDEIKEICETCDGCDISCAGNVMKGYVEKEVENEEMYADYYLLVTRGV